MKNRLTTGTRSKAKVIRLTKELERIEAGIAAMQARWREADEYSESIDFLNRRLNGDFEKRALLEVEISQGIVRRFASKKLNKGHTQ